MHMGHLCPVHQFDLENNTKAIHIALLYDFFRNMPGGTVWARRAHFCLRTQVFVVYITFMLNCIYVFCTTTLLNIHLFYDFHYLVFVAVMSRHYVLLGVFDQWYVLRTGQKCVSITIKTVINK